LKEAVMAGIGTDRPMTDLYSPHTALFRRRTAEVMTKALPGLSHRADCRALVGLLRHPGPSGVLVLGDAGRILGLVTREDVVSKITFRVGPDTPVTEVMHSPVPVVRESDHLFHAIAVMRRHGLRFLPVIDDSGGPVGTVYLEQALSQGLPNQLTMLASLTGGDDDAALRSVKQAQVSLAEILAADGATAPEIQSVMTEVNNDIYRRVIERHIEAMQSEGWGDPEIVFEVIVMGSGGRGENFLTSDQDNGLILDSYPDGRHNTVDTYFFELAKRMTATLDRVGIPSCRGFVMATNPLWRKRLDQWRAQIGYWLKRPGRATLRLSDIFFDFRPVFGGGGMALALRRHLMENVPHHHLFLQEMQSLQQDHGVALGPFKQLSTERGGGGHSGKLNLKYHGLLPLVEAVRLLALRSGLAETSTLARIEALHAASVLDDEEKAYLSGAFTLLSGLILHQQIREYRQGRQITTSVSPKALSALEKDQLIDGLSAISRLRRRVHNEFTGEI